MAKRADPPEHHGDVFVDPYEWLRDKDSPEVAHLEAENDFHTERTTAHLEPLRQRSSTKSKRVLKPTYRCRRDAATGGTTARTFEEQYGVHRRCPVTDPDDWNLRFDERATGNTGEQLLLDENVEADGLLRTGRGHVSLDDNLLAYLPMSVVTNACGRRENTKNVHSSDR